MSQQASSSSKGSLTPDRIMQMAWAYAPPLIVGTAVQYKLFDRIDAAPKTAEQVAGEAGLSPRAVRIVLNALVGFELLTRDGQQRYATTPESSTFLVSTKPSFQGGIFRHMDTQLIPRWLKLPETVRTGRPAAEVNREDRGAEFFEQFVEDIFPMSYGAAQALADHLRIADARGAVKVLDLGTGSGVWGIAMAKRSPQVRVTAVDWPAVFNVTRRVTARHGVAEQFQYVPGDLDSVDFGTGYDVVTIGHILHSEGPERSRRLLRRAAGAMAPGGTIAIAEFLANDARTGPPMALLFAVNMLVNTSDGDTFTFPEIAGWLREAGLVNPRLLEAPGPSPLILASKE